MTRYVTSMSEGDEEKKNPHVFFLFFFKHMYKCDSTKIKCLTSTRGNSNNITDELCSIHQEKTQEQKNLYFLFFKFLFAQEQARLQDGINQIRLLGFQFSPTLEKTKMELIHLFYSSSLITYRCIHYISQIISDVIACCLFQHF